jgi:hypothetical protein
VPVPRLEAIGPALYSYEPAAAPVTATENGQNVPLGRLPPERAIVLVALVVVRVPPQTLVEVLATLRPAGSELLKASPVTDPLTSSVTIAKLSELESPRAMVPGTNVTDKAGAVARTAAGRAMAAVSTATNRAIKNGRDRRPTGSSSDVSQAWTERTGRIEGLRSGGTA